MPRRPNKKAQRYGDHEERVAKATKDLAENPESKMKQVAAQYELNSDTIRNCYHGKTQTARVAHLEPRSPTGEQERSVEGWVELRNPPGYPPKHKKLRRMIVLGGGHYVGIHFPYKTSPACAPKYPCRVRTT